MNPLKNKALVISRSRTLMPVFPNLMLNGTVVERVIELKFLGVALDALLSFEGHILSGKCLSGDPVFVLRCFWSFLLPVLEYCSPVWMVCCSFSSWSF